MAESSLVFEFLKYLGIRIQYFVTFVVVMLSIMITIITVFDFKSDNDLDLYSKSLLNEENVQFQIRTNENKFRKSLFNEVKFLEYSNSKEFDAITRKYPYAEDLRKYMIINGLKRKGSRYEFTVDLDKFTTFFVQVTGLKVTFEIDFTKLENIGGFSKYRLNEDNIVYGNYLKTKYEYIKKIRYDYVSIFIFGVIVILLFVHFRDRIGIRDEKKSIDSPVKYKEVLDGVLFKAEKEIITREDFNKLIEEVEIVRSSLGEYEKNNLIVYILKDEVIKSERKSVEIYNRSTLMLILGLMIAVLGVIIFYITLPEYSRSARYPNYLSMAIRPTFLLLFIQSIAVYLLKQYRSLINDYKYFYEEYLRKVQLFTAYQLIQSTNIREVDMKLIDKLLSFENEMHKSGEVENEALPQDKVIDLIKALIEKTK